MGYFCTMSHIVAPSLLAADFTDLKHAVEIVDNSPAEWLHLDVMDGMFVPNISFGIPVISALRPLTEKVFDVHLMVDKPERYLEDFRKAGADVITVHYEASTHLHRSLGAIKELGAKAGVALNPHTNVDLLDDVLEDIDLVCLMSVNPGFGGQKFIYRTLSKIRQLKQKIIERNLATKIEIDGGVGLQNAEVILKAGADVLVAGSSVYRADSPLQVIESLKDITTHTII